MARMSGVARRARRFAAAATLAVVAFVPAARAADGIDTGSEIVVQALSLLGVPYRWGGNDPMHGLDCSGLVRHVFKSVGLADLPRRSQEMRRLGAGVSRADLRAGDLVFFNTLGAPFSHVAIYVGEGRFVHAPARHGQVRVDDMEDRYWRTRFNGARRLGSSETTAALPSPSAASAVAAAASASRVDDVLGGP